VILIYRHTDSFDTPALKEFKNRAIAFAIDLKFEALRKGYFQFFISPMGTRVLQLKVFIFDQTKYYKKTGYLNF